MEKVINLNADLGESYGAWTIGNDNAMLQVVASANVACGFHAGDPLVMQETVAAAKAHGVSIGAHPSFPDRQGFGRRRMDLSAKELTADLIYQIGALSAVATTQGIELSHVKPHGALNNLAAEDISTARIIAKAIKIFNPKLALLAPALSFMVDAANEIGLKVFEEIFADRAYQDNGQLVPRSQANAMIHQAKDSLNHVLNMLNAQSIISINGKFLPTKIASICVHGDGENAVNIARTIRSGLEQNGYKITALN